MENIVQKKSLNKSEVIITNEPIDECHISIPAHPQLDDGMIPIYWDKDNIIKKADDGNTNVEHRWYDYDEQIWANVVLVKADEEGNPIRSKYQMSQPGTTIDQEDVLAYLVWIPRYRYKLFNIESDVISPQEIKIIFEDKNTDKSRGTNPETDEIENGQWYTHPAFTFGENNEINGFWVGKFETSTIETFCYSDAKIDNCNNVNQIPVIKPKVNALRYQNVRNQFITAQKFDYEITGTYYGLTTNYDAHIMKSLEWGVVAYLSHSRYGKYGNNMYTGANKEIYQNKSNTYETGSSNGDPSSPTYREEQCSYDDMTIEETGKGYCGPGASTTGNIYGVYDMSGGAYEYVMGVMVDGSNKIIDLSANFNETPVIDIDSSGMAKYVNKYSINTGLSPVYKNRILGDAIGETYGWYDLEGVTFVSSAASWFLRGGFYGNGDGAGAFYYFGFDGTARGYNSFRVVFSPSA